jgi:hypothetical protein
LWCARDERFLWNDRRAAFIDALLGDAQKRLALVQLLAGDRLVSSTPMRIAHPMSNFFCMMMLCLPKMLGLQVSSSQTALDSHKLQVG